MANTPWQGTDLYRARIPGTGSDQRFPMIKVCTASDGRIADRVAAGEDAVDVADDFSSALWFTDRESFKVAWRCARWIAKGKVFAASTALEAGQLNWLDFGPACRLRLIVLPSRHHLQSCEAA